MRCIACLSVGSPSANRDTYPHSLSVSLISLSSSTRRCASRASLLFIKSLPLFPRPKIFYSFANVGWTRAARYVRRVYRITLGSDVRTRCRINSRSDACIQSTRRGGDGALSRGAPLLVGPSLAALHPRINKEFVKRSHRSFSFLVHPAGWPADGRTNGLIPAAISIARTRRALPQHPLRCSRAISDGRIGRRAIRPKVN